MFNENYPDINAHISEVNSTDTVIVYNKQSILQSLYRLINTREGDIMYYRAYGLNLRQFMHYPLTEFTGNLIFQYIVSKINRFENRVNILDAQSIIEINTDNDQISFEIFLQIKGTDEVFNINISDVIVNK